MNETTKKINELREEIEKLENEIYELKRKNSNYYIGVCKVGDFDYWDEYYYQLGFITEADAEAWVEKQRDDEDCVFDAKYFEVTKEIYDKYDDWYRLDNLKGNINLYSLAINKLEGIDSLRKSVDKAIEDLAKEIGIEYLSFMHPARR